MKFVSLVFRIEDGFDSEFILEAVECMVFQAKKRNLSPMRAPEAGKFRVGIAVNDLF